MTTPKQFCIFFVLLSLFSALVVGKQEAYGDDTNLDFWWDYGEADEKNATFAPAMDSEITRKYGVEVVSLERRKVFVADEYLQIRYLIRVPFDVRIDEKKLPQKLAPFGITEFHFGQRRAIKKERDMEQQELLLTVRLNTSFPYDTYILPSFELHYQYNTIVGDKSIAREKTVATEEVLLKKVPVYVRVRQSRDTGFLWDIFTCLLEIHVDSSATLLNLDQYSDIDPLIQFKPPYPFVLQGQTRSEFSSDLYRVIRYEYMIAVQDFRNQPFTLTLPPVVWQQDGASPDSKKNIITPESFIFFIQSITSDSTRLHPLKRDIAALPDERYGLLVFPLRILLSIVAFGLLWFSFLLWHHHKQQVKIGKVVRGSKPAHPTYDKWPWQNVVLGFRIIKARHKFQRRPRPKSCADLRELLARRTAMGLLSAKHKLTIAEVCAFTAVELAQLGAKKQEINDLLQLEYQLESGQYKKLRDKDDLSTP